MVGCSETIYGTLRFAPKRDRGLTGVMNEYR
jgi:hypothetical protein